jgi:hypothetical protein
MFAVDFGGKEGSSYNRNGTIGGASSSEVGSQLRRDAFGKVGSRKYLNPNLPHSDYRTPHQKSEDLHSAPCRTPHNFRCTIYDVKFLIQPSTINHQLKTPYCFTTLRITAPSWVANFR